MYITTDRFQQLPDPAITFHGYREQYHTRFSEFDDIGYCFEKQGKHFVIYAFSRGDDVKIRLIHPANESDPLPLSAIESLLSFIIDEYEHLIHSHAHYRLRYLTGDFNVNIEE